MTTMNDVELTEEQQAAVEFCTRGDKDVVRLGGFAGCGKSVCVAEMSRALPNHAVCAYTGKAANVLRRKGIERASTIHSLIYKPVGEGDDVQWELRSPWELPVDGFLVDEASMISSDLNRDLRSFGLPIVFVGDHGQLEPVSADRDGFCLMREPDVTLEKIHRNAGEIARFAEWLRNGNDAKEWDGERMLDGAEHAAGIVNVITGDQMADAGMEADDQIVCAYNRTRCMYNNVVREHLEFPAGEPVVGDRIICLQNDRERHLFNGMQGKIKWINAKRRLLTFEDEDGRTFRDVRYNPAAFGAERTPKREFGVIPFDWAYCVTCHKMQGSEADNVMVIEQRCDLWDHRRWAYTAASRAKRRLIWVTG